MVETFREMGRPVNDAFMQINRLALVVFPEMRISNDGLVDVSAFQLVPLLTD